MSDLHERMLGAAQVVLDRAAAVGDIPGGVCAIALDGRPIGTVASGVRAVIDEHGAPLADEARVAVDPAIRYDLASVTKLFTAVAVLKLAEHGVLELDARVADVLPEFRGGQRMAVTPRHLLTHTSGLPADWDGWHDYVGEGTDAAGWATPPRERVLAEILSTPLVREPESGFEYSCLGYITAMAYAEMITGRPWEAILSETVLAPRELTAITFGAPPEQSAPTEWQPELGRGLVRGVVHDEKAFALGGVSGNAGLFATADDLLQFGLAIAPAEPGASESRILGGSVFAAFWEDALPELTAAAGWDASTTPDFGQGAGPRIGQAAWMTDACLAARGHPGFTGTSLMIDPDRSLVIALLTNRVHPSRLGADGNAIRSQLTAAVCAVLDDNPAQLPGMADG
jgi:CubicO group peptidase (beta-lactamase class C family)